jgi:hypothetical protein
VAGMWLPYICKVLFFSPYRSQSFHTHFKNVFYDLERPEIFGVSNCILWDVGTELFKIHKNETPGQTRMNGINICISTTFYNIDILNRMLTGKVMYV